MVGATDQLEPAKLAIDDSLEESFAHFVGSIRYLARFPRLGYAIAWGYTLSACFAGSLNGYHCAANVVSQRVTPGSSYPTPSA